MGNDHFASVHEKGSVVLEFSSGKSITLFNVLYVPKLRIIPETTAPYTPQQNGMVERKNKDLKEMVNSMLSYSGLSEPNDYVSINTIIESRDAIFDDNPFSSIPRPKDIILNLDGSQRDDHSNDVPSETLKPCKGSRDEIGSQYSYCYSIEEDPRYYNEAMQSQDVAFWKEAIDDEIGSIMENNTWVLFDFQLSFNEGSRDHIRSQCSYCYSIKEDPRTYNEARQSRDVAFWKEAIDDEIGSIMENNTWVLSDLPPGYKPLYCKWIFKRKIKVDGTIGKFKARLIIPDSAYAVGRLSSFTSNPSRQHWHATTRVFKCLKGTMSYGLSYVGYPSVLEGYSDASWINYVEDSSSTSGWVFLLGGEVEWPKNLIHDIPIWLKPIALISINCDSAVTLAKAYSQIYNGKSIHLGVRHSMIRELITNGVISIEFLWSQYNLADHLTKALARDLVIKSGIWMGLKSI
nr:zinc finger, CCHC-type [Tanacetum cinerariifolium]